MEQTEKQVTLKKLTASAGMWLTQADETIKDEDRYFTQEVYLSEEDSADNWTEWDDARKTEAEEQRKSEIEKAYEALQQQ
jgi:hypothetical protein